MVKIWPLQNGATVQALKSFRHSEDTPEAALHPEDTFISVALMLSIILELPNRRYHICIRLTATDYSWSPSLDDSSNRSLMISASVYNNGNISPLIYAYNYAVQSFFECITYQRPSVWVVINWDRFLCIQSQQSNFSITTIVANQHMQLCGYEDHARIVCPYASRSNRV